MNKQIFGFLLLMAMNHIGFAQSVLQIPNGKSYHIIDRLDIKYGLSDTIHTSVKNYNKKSISAYTHLLLNNAEILSEKDKSNLKFLLNDHNEFRLLTDEHQELYVQNDKAFLKHFYKSPANFYELEKADFILKINPILNAKLGSESGSEYPVFQNTRGIDIRGVIDNKVYFYTSIYENQQRFFNFIERRIQSDFAIPGQGSFKEYQSSIIDKLKGHDFLNAQAYVGIPISKSIAIEFGHGKHFIGNGYHSLILSDYSHNYFYLKFNTKIWKFHYQNIFAELSALGPNLNPGDNLVPKKYMATHYLNFKPNDRFEIGLFESVVFNRLNHFEFQYLNPVILYRTVEQFLDSPDNVLMGLNFKFNILRKFSIYGQFMLDELKINEFLDGSGWWGNKYGWQIGLKYIDVFGVDQLDGQIEINSVRPYTYSHRDTIENFNDFALASYSHSNQALAHPLGSNFTEVLMRLQYQLNEKLGFESRLIFTTYGADDENNYGGNILRSFTNRVDDFGNTIGQGVENDILILGLDVHYRLFHNAYVDFNVLYRKQDSEDASQSLDTKYFGGGLRINVANQKLDY